MSFKPKVLVIGGAGYVGSYLTKFMQSKIAQDKINSVDSCDVIEAPWVNIVGNYMELTQEMLGEYSHFLFFAGCSSVNAAKLNPRRALEENCLQPLAFTEALRPDQTFIYASSASIYSTPHVQVGTGDQAASNELTAIGYPQNPYDASKAAADYLFSIWKTEVNLSGLRMGTVSGVSPRMRPELVFNSMVSAAIDSGELILRNSNSWRTILFLDDLANLVMALISSRGNLPPLVNAGSLSMTIGELGNRIANHLGAKVRQVPDSKTYSFALNTDLHLSLSPVAEMSLEERIDQFLRERQVIGS